MRKITEFDWKLRMKIVYAYKQDYGYTTLFNCFDIPRSTIQSIIKKFNTTHCIENILWIGRKRLISEITERKIAIDSTKNPQLIAKDIVTDLKTAGLNV